MSAGIVLARIAHAARVRRIAIVALLGTPLLAGIVALAARTPGAAPWQALLIGGLLFLAAIAWRAARSIDAVWVARALDASGPGLEDSATLLFVDEAQLSPLQRLQRERITRWLVAATAPDLRAPWPRIALLLAWSAGLALTTTAIFWPPGDTTPTPSALSAGAGREGVAISARIMHQRLDIVPPAYTGLPPRLESELSTRIPQGAHLSWTLHIDPMPAAAALVFHDDIRVPLRRDGDSWRASRTLAVSTLYRVALAGAPALARDPLFRLDVAADQPPLIRVLEPERALTILEPAQREWTLAFEASDDYGLGAAQLHVTLAQGGGENISVTESTLALAGVGSATLQRYSHRLDLAVLGIAAGDDVIARLSVRDKRAPKPQTTRGASFILRWPPQASAESNAMEGIVVRTLPAYFRSQRQIIIDSEMLIAERPRLQPEPHLARSDSIGVDQRILRMRYGQFLGEEYEGGLNGTAAPGAAPPDSDPGEAVHGHDDAEAGAVAHDEAAAMIAEYGHSHDDAEAATLLDPETRRLLKAALDQMWQAELHLRLGAPERALPFEYRALGYIKQVQQASRIYLARVGLELPPIDETRRLTGDRSGLHDRDDALAPATPEDPLLASVWQRLDPVAPERREAGVSAQAPSAAAGADLETLQRWIRTHERELPDALGLLTAVDALRRNPDCSDCARRLRSMLWPLLPKPAAATGPRAASDRAGRVYLQALRAGFAP